MLKVKLEKGDLYNQEWSPSIDRIKPELGYVPGNIMVMSKRANTLKRDGTLEELQERLKAGAETPSA